MTAWVTVSPRYDSASRFSFWRMRAAISWGVYCLPSMSGRLPALAHVALDRPEGALRVGDGLALGHLADEHLARLREGDDGRRGPGALGVGDDDGFAGLEERDDGVGGAEVDADGLGHGWISWRCGTDECAPTVLRTRPGVANTVSRKLERLRLNCGDCRMLPLVGRHGSAEAEGRPGRAGPLVAGLDHELRARSGARTVQVARTRSGVPSLRAPPFELEATGGRRAARAPGGPGRRASRPRWAGSARPRRAAPACSPWPAPSPSSVASRCWRARPAPAMSPRRAAAPRPAAARGAARRGPGTMAKSAWGPTSAARRPAGGLIHDRSQSQPPSSTGPSCGCSNGYQSTKTSPGKCSSAQRSTTELLLDAWVRSPRSPVCGPLAGGGRDHVPELGGPAVDTEVVVGPVVRRARHQLGLSQVKSSNREWTG